MQRGRRRAGAGPSFFSRLYRPGDACPPPYRATVKSNSPPTELKLLSKALISTA